MIKTIEYFPQGTCSKKMTIFIDTETGKITDFTVVGGCNGNLKGIRSLIIGMDAKDVHDKLRGTLCGFRQTSCPDQIACALESFFEEEK